MKHDRPQAADPHHISGALAAVLIALALRQTDPVERAAMLAILKKDGWL